MRKSNNKSSSELKHKVSKMTMKSRIFASFILFSFVVIAVMWISQTVFMESLYKRVRIYETKQCADRLSSVAADETAEVAQSLSEKYSMCISVYMIANGRGTLTAEAHTNYACFIHNVASDNLLSKLYSRAIDAGGEYTETVSLSSLRGGKAESGSGESVLIASVTANDGAERLVLLNTEIYPLSSTVSTVRMMLLFASIVLVVIAAVMSILLSRRLSRPVAEMNREAGRLALGRYDVNFTGGGCRELDGLADTLNHASHELAGLDRMQKDLIANISHDLRTPLTMISGYSEMMRDIPGEMTPENMQTVIDETNRLSSLVNDMLDMSRFISGKQTLNLTRFSLTEAVRETVERYSKLREREEYVIDFESDCEATVCADKTRILQVIYNLVNNAINYTGDDRRVLIRQSLTEDGWCRIEVIDSGCGIPEADLPFIWERYYKANEFHRRLQMGTGLGLSIVKNILALHGARFGVMSRVGHGSTFWFELQTVKDGGNF